MITLALDAESGRFITAQAQPLSAALPLGASALCAQWLRHDPPTALEVEAAIEAVEDLVMPLHGRWPADAELCVQLQDRAAASFSVLAGPRLARAQLESLFDRAAAIAMGRPASSDPQLADARVIAILLVVREAMHHLGFTHAILV